MADPERDHDEGDDGAPPGDAGPAGPVAPSPDSSGSRVPGPATLPDWSVPRVLAGALAFAILLALLAGGVTSAAAFGAFNPAWDGTSEFRALGEAGTGSDAVILREVAAYDDFRAGPAADGSQAASGAAATTTDPAASDAVPANGTLAVVLSPRSAYENPGPVRRFVERGGTLLVAEDVGPHGNALLEAVGATARVDGRPLRDEREHGPAPGFPAAPNVSDHPYVAGVEALELNHGTAVQPGNATVLATTSSYAYLDADGDAVPGDDETLAAHPVATAESVGEGTVVVVGDPSLFVNAMIDARDNRAFVRALAGAHDRVALDTTHGGGLPALVTARLTLLETPWLQLAVGGLGLLAVVLAPRLFDAIRRRLGGPGVDVGDGAKLADEALVDAGPGETNGSARQARPDRSAARTTPESERPTDTVMKRRPESGSNDRSE